MSAFPSPPIEGLDSGGMIGEGAVQSAAFRLTAARLQDADRAGEDRLRIERENRRSHIEYWTGRWYGKEHRDGTPRPLNLMAQMIMAFGVQITPMDFRARLRPKRSGLDGEAKQINALIDNNMAEQRASEDIFGPMVIDALISPWATLYTGLRPGREVLTIDAQDVDPGEPFTQFIEFDDVAVDPSAKDIRRALWFRHRYRVPRHWLLESPAFADKRDLITRLPAFEDDGGNDQDNRGENISVSSKDRQEALFDTVELLNFVIYDHNRIIECTVTPKDRGPSEFLRRDEWVGPDGGPYNFLSFWRVPGNLPSLSPAATTRDVAEAGDIAFRKIQEQGERSKVVMGYQAGSEEDAAQIAEAADGSSVKLDDPSKVQVYDMTMISERLVGILQVIQQGYQDLAGNPALLNGSAENSETLGQDQILNMRAGARVSYMSLRVVSTIREVVRKWAWYFQTDPTIQANVPITIPGMGQVPVPYSAMTRQGEPADFKYDVRLISQPNADPNVQAERSIMFLDTISRMMPMFMPPAPGVPPPFKLRGVVEDLAPKFGIENPEELINDIEMEIERLMADAAADYWLQRASAAAPDLAGPGMQSRGSNPMGAPTGLPSPMGMGGGPAGGFGAPAGALVGGGQPAGRPRGSRGR